MIKMRRGRGRNIYRTTTEVVPSKLPSRKKNQPNPIGKFIIHSNHQDLIKDLNPALQHHTIISIDPGTKNYAFRIEKRYNSLFGNYNLSIVTVAMTKKEFDDTRHHVNNNGTRSQLYVDLIKFLDMYKDQYPTASMVIIERQMSDNSDMWRMSQATIDYFIIKYPDIIVIEVDAHLKSKAFNAPKMTRPELKKWDIDTAERILMARGDEDGLKIMKSYKKMDDIADTVIAIEALFVHLNLQITNPEGMTITTFR